MTSSTDQLPKSKKKRLRAVLIGMLFVFLFLFLMLYKLDTWPSAWWDEGWYLDAARNWIEHAHIGHYLDGQPIPPHIPVRLPVLVPMAISMKIFGVGIWQGRLPGALLTLPALGLLIYLSNKMYNRKTAIITIIIIIFLSPLDFNSVYLGRQIWAEMSMMFYLLAGYALLWVAISHTPVWGIGAAVMFGIANHTKLQVPPFWFVSMVLALWVAARNKQKKALKLISGITGGSMLVFAIIYIIQNRIMPGSFTDTGLTTLLFNTVIAVFTIPVRGKALILGATYALPQILGLIFVGKQILTGIIPNQNTKKQILDGEKANKEILRAALWGIAASWCVWYLAMALFWVRYLFPAYFLGSIFFVVYLGKLTDGFNYRTFINNVAAFIMVRKLNRINFQSVIVLIGLSLLLGATLKTTGTYITTPHPNPQLAADYLEKNIPKGAKVETFGSELFILAEDINFHYPSDLVSMQMYRKWIADPQIKIDYDPLADNPDYLVVDPFSAYWMLYDIVVPQDRLQLEEVVGGYKIYKILYAY
jgi:4-amino-4-deoxy-L-arabinose transferase-like glycosyltransferase